MKTLPHRSPNARRQQAGVTLIELLVSITIGLFIIGAALMVFQNVSGIGRQISELTQIRQQGAHAFRAMSKQVREAGAIEPVYTSDNGNYEFGNPDWANPTAIAAWTPPNGSADFLSISQQVSTSTAYSALLRNCLGETVTTTTRRSDFYLANNGDLMCVTGSNAGGQPIVSNVNAFTVRYRVRATPTTMQFVAAPTDWSLVDAVEVCLDLVGTTPLPTGTATTYTDCSGSTANRNNRLHVVQRNLFTVFSGQR